MILSNAAGREVPEPAGWAPHARPFKERSGSDLEDALGPQRRVPGRRFRAPAKPWVRRGPCREHPHRSAPQDGRPAGGGCGGELRGRPGTDGGMAVCAAPRMVRRPARGAVDRGSVTVVPRFGGAHAAGRTRLVAEARHRHERKAQHEQQRERRLADVTPPGCSHATPVEHRSRHRMPPDSITGRATREQAGTSGLPHPQTACTTGAVSRASSSAIARSRCRRSPRT